MISKKLSSSTSGFIALVSVLIVGALIIVISVNLVWHSISEIHISLDEEIASKTLSAATACAELGLLKLKKDFNYSGESDIIVDASSNLSCDILAPTGTGGANRVIKTQSAINGYTSRLQINIFTLRPLSISSWEEIP